MKTFSAKKLSSFVIVGSASLGLMRDVLAMPYFSEQVVIHQTVTEQPQASS